MRLRINAASHRRNKKGQACGLTCEADSGGSAIRLRLGLPNPDFACGHPGCINK